MKFTIKNQTIVDENNRECIFNGINLVFKGEEIGGVRNYIRRYDKSVFMTLQQNGINLIRLGIVWDAIENVYKKYSDEYLQSIRDILDACKEHQIHVFLDMHQDLYSVKYGGGAPLWATIDNNKEHIKTDMWSDSYLYSEAVNESFRNFWTNQKTIYNVGLIDHYKQVWEHIIIRFKDHEAIIGYDFMNEPFAGHNSQLVMKKLLQTYAQLKQVNISEQELTSLFTDFDKKLMLLNDLENQELYKKVVDSAKDIIHDFDQNELANFYNEMTTLLRKYNETQFVLTENSYFSNLGIEAGTTKVITSGEVDKFQVYSPHGYDLVVDTEYVNLSSNKRIKVILDNHQKVANKLQTPVIFGEWGAHYQNEQGLKHLQYIINYFDDNKWSHTYYCLFDGIENNKILDVLNRPYPKAVAGKIISYNYDFDSKQFNLKWQQGENGKVDSEIYLPYKPSRIITKCNYQLRVNNNYYLLSITGINGFNELTVNL